jgi:trehalose-phosphatase
MDPSAPGPLALARLALAPRPAALVTDLDGTLSPIVSDPAAARPADGAVEALGAVQAAGIEIVIMTGRSAATARALIGTDRFLIVANHGAEWLGAGAEAVPATADRPVSVERAIGLVRTGDGIEIEWKAPTATIHFRNAPDPERARRQVTEQLAAADPSAVELHPGRMSLEVRPAGAPNKGEALRELVARRGLRGLVVIGDDVTDLDMFRAAAELRADGTLEGAAILAVAGGGEVPPEVTVAADATLASPADVVALLAALGGQLTPEVRPSA